MKLKLILAILLLPVAAVAQSLSGVMASSRMINWTSAGLPSTLTYGTGGTPCTGSQSVGANCYEAITGTTAPPTRIQCGTTLSSPSVATVQADLIACPAGSYLLYSGTITLASTNLNLFEANGGCTSPGNCPAAGLNGGGVTLRGTGSNSSKIVMTGSSVIGFGVSWSAPSCTVSASPNRGDTTLSLSSCSTNPVKGQMVFMKQCDAGWSGSGCSTGSSVDNGAVYVCGWDPICQNPANPPTTPHSEQQQNFLITNISGTCTSSCTVTVSPSVYLNNWSTSNTPVVTWTGQVPGQNAPATTGLGLEDMTIDQTGTNWGGLSSNWGIDLDNCYGCWIKGVRIIGQGAAGGGLNIRNAKNNLVANNDIFDNPFDSGDNLIVIQSTSSDNLIVNNIMQYGDCLETDGGNEGNVWSHNFCRDANTQGYFVVFFQHVAGQAFELYEGNQLGATDYDTIHGFGKNLNTQFRNYISGSDPPFTGAAGPFGIEVDQGNRFNNLVGNIIGSSLITSYSGSGSNVAFKLGSGCCGQEPLATASLLRWGNCDTGSGTCRNNSGENPSTLTAYASGSVTLSGSGTGPWTGTISGANLPILFGSEVLIDQTTGQSPNTMGYDTAGNGTITGANIVSATVNNSSGSISVTFSGTPPVTPKLQYIYSTGGASPFQNISSPSTSLPCSAWMPSYTSTNCVSHTSGGTGLSWWGVVTSWATFPTSPAATQFSNFPAAGPDISGGPYTAGTGSAYDIPAAVAYKYLPIDTSYQKSYTITGSSWSGGVETLTLSSPPSSFHHVMGGFQLSGVNSACIPAGINFSNLYGNNEVFITASSIGSGTVSYALSPNPGLSCTGTFLWPNVRQFDERVYINDPPLNVTPAGFFLAGKRDLYKIRTHDESKGR